MKKTSISLLALAFIVKVNSLEEQQHTFKLDHSKSTCSPTDAHCWPTPEEWHQLNQTVNGNLIAVAPAALACYSGKHYDSAACAEHRKNYDYDIHRGTRVGAVQNTNWETCGDEQCLLPSDPLGSLLGQLFPSTLGTCSSAGLPRYALVADKPEEIAAVIQFAKSRQIALNIKNTGHDYLGRSTSPDSITIWTHHLKKIEFDENYQVCDQPPQTAFRFGAGVNWLNAYGAAHEKNVTIVGGAQPGVGVAGGWLQGGGHSMLSPAYGLGVDQVLEFKVVLANGSYVTASRCQEPDLFWALRGGGGGTFGVVTEIVVRTRPTSKTQLIHLDIIGLPFTGGLRDLLIEFARHSPRWSKEGWGGYAYYYGYNRLSFAYGNPLLTAKEAEISMKPLLDFIKSSKKYFIWRKEIHELDSFYGIFENVMAPHSEIVSTGVRIASRIIPQELFKNENLETLIDAFLEGTKKTQPLSLVLPTQILSITSPNVLDLERETSVQPLMREGVWHVIYTSGWAKGTPNFIKRKHSRSVHEAIEPIRKLTPGGGAYINEADILEPEWRQSFWSLENYKRLVQIKKVYDPDNVFHCWKCIGWDEKMVVEDKKYKCYKY